MTRLRILLLVICALTLRLAAKRPGTHLRVLLTKPPIDVGEAHELVELNGHVDQAEPIGKVEAPILSIVEIEVYRPVSGPWLRGTRDLNKPLK